MKYRGMDQIINDDLSSMPVSLGCFICYMICVPCLFATYKIFPGIVFVAVTTSTEQSAGLWIMSFAFAACALMIPINMLTTIPSFVQALYVCWADDPRALDVSHPAEAQMLKNAAYRYNKYQVRY